MMPPTGTLCHQIPGRARVRIPSCRGDRSFFLRAEEVLRGCEGVSAVETNPYTGSVLVHHAVAADTIWRCAQEAGLFRLERDTGALGQASEQPQWAAAPVALLEQAANRATGLQGLLFLAFVMLAIWQTAEGNVMAPAVTLLWYAAQVMRAGDQPA